jgi:hypothetical protein
MNTELLSTLQNVQAALAKGQPLDRLGAYLHEGRILTVPTKRGPASFHLRDLDTIMRSVRGDVAKLQPAPVLPSPVPVAKVQSKAAAIRNHAAELKRFLHAIAKGLEDQRSCLMHIRTEAGTAKALALPDAVKALQDEARAVFRFTTPRETKPTPPPRRAVGNFTTCENRERTLDALEHNLREAIASGHEPLVRVMREALAVATDRRVDQKPNLI